MNIYQQQHETRISIISELFENHYRHQIDDFFEARDQLLKDIEESFLKKFDLNFRVIAIDSELSTKEARNVIKEIGHKLI